MAKLTSFFSKGLFSKKATPSEETPKDAKAIILELRHIRKDYMVGRKPFTAIKDLSLCFPKTGFVAILGPSGCGKTTLLNLIGGLDHYTSGDLLINGRSTKGFVDRDWDSYRNKRIGFVFQTYNLIPHYSVLQNVEISMTLNGADRKARYEKAKTVLEKVGLGDILTKKPNQLSGGQMQRVAIARALVNDPEIILADEPTGALDSDTSVQVIDLIKEVGKNHCVIMVTHNRELAEQYADRIIEMKDGEVSRDSAPLASDNVEPIGIESAKKTSMSFWTAIRSSGQSILTKKGRTILTAVASSFGIIGVALVLATRNGFSIYVGNVEGSIASSVPISVSPTVYDYKQDNIETPKDYPDKTDIHVDSNTTSTYITHRNNYVSDGGNYINYINRLVTDSDKKGLVSGITYNHSGLDFHMLTENGSSGSVMQVSQYSSAGSNSNIISSATSLPATVAHELYAKDKYETIYGKYPEKMDEVVLIVNKYNQIDLSTLKKLGILSNSIVTPPDTIPFSSVVYDYEDGKTDTEYKQYKCYRNSDFFQVGKSIPLTKTVDAWEISSFDEATGTYSGKSITKDLKYYTQPALDEVYGQDSKYAPIDLKVVGILRPTKDSFISLMPASMGYLSSLTDTLAKDTEKGQPGEPLAAEQTANWYIPRTGDKNDGLAILNANIQAVLAAQSSSSITSMSQNTFLGALNGVFRFSYAYAYDSTDPGTTTNMSTFLNMCHYVGSSFADVNPPSFDDLDGWTTLLENPLFFNTTVVDYLAYYSSYAVISSILIFPASLTTKDRLRDYLDKYNKDHDGNPKPDVDQIIYSDIMDTYTSSLGILINVISAVLIVFASISLAVSSVMTAIITYVSVLERTKEIGILRACGARKVDIRRLFEAECMITGFVAGVIGIGVSLLICIPINLTLDNLYSNYQLSSIAQLNPIHAVILLVLAVFLAFISGFIPARIAAGKDPVECLRSE